MKSKVFPHYPGETHPLCYPPKMWSRGLWSLLVNKDRSPVPVPVSDGGETSVLSHVAVCPSAQPVCFETHQTQAQPESPSSVQTPYQSSGNAVLRAKSTWLAASELKYLRSAQCNWQRITGSCVQNKNFGAAYRGGVVMRRGSQCWKCA